MCPSPAIRLHLLINSAHEESYYPLDLLVMAVLSLMLWLILFTAASGGWQEPENPHTQRVSFRL